MSALKTTIRRELIENRISAIWLPIGIGITIILLMIGALIWHGNFVSGTSGELQIISGLDPEVGSPVKKQVATALMAALSLPFFIPLSFVVVFYLAHALFDERKDRSILFWKSLPISDRLTVGSKILMAVAVIPFIYWCALLATQILTILILALAGVTLGQDLIPVLFQPAVMASHALSALVAVLLHGLWLLPLYAWLLFCSSWAPRSPLMVAIAVMALLSLMVNLWNTFQSMNFAGFQPLSWVIQRANESPLPLSFQLSLDPGERIAGEVAQLSELLGYLVSPSMWLGILIALPLLLGALYMRTRATA